MPALLTSISRSPASAKALHVRRDRKLPLGGAGPNAEHEEFCGFVEHGSHRRGKRDRLTGRGE